MYIKSNAPTQTECPLIYTFQCCFGCKVAKTTREGFHIYAFEHLHTATGKHHKEEYNIETHVQRRVRDSAVCMCIMGSALIEKAHAHPEASNLVTHTTLNKNRKSKPYIVIGKHALLVPCQPIERNTLTSLARDAKVDDLSSAFQRYWQCTPQRLPARGRQTAILRGLQSGEKLQHTMSCVSEFDRALL
jgi:hypothetical protein